MADEVLQLRNEWRRKGKAQCSIQELLRSQVVKQWLSLQGSLRFSLDKYSDMLLVGSRGLAVSRSAGDTESIPGESLE